MTTDNAAGVRPDPLGRALYLAATGLAVFGGLILFALTLLTVVSVIGRAVFNTPVPGDFELVELGMAVAVFSFLPYCQITRGNVIVDLFTADATPRTKALLDGIANLAYTAVAALLTWRLAVGGFELRTFAETSMVLGVPVWWGYVPAVAFLGFLTVVCAYTAWRSAQEYRRGVAHDDQGRVAEEAGL